MKSHYYNLYIKQNMDWNTIIRDFKDQPFLAPVFNLYYRWMDIKRYDHMPFYLYPAAK